MAGPADAVRHTPAHDTVSQRSEKDDITTIPAEADELGSSDSDSTKQAGVQGVEAVTRVWSTKTLWLTFLLLWIVSFFDSLGQSVNGSLTPYVTSSFGEHGLLSTTSVMATIIGGVANLTISKIINVFGRWQGFTFMLSLLVLGLILMAVCQNVETYAAANTFYWVGHLGIGYVISVVYADMTSLKNRMLIYGFNSTPGIATTFAGPALAQAFYEQVNFRWGFGTFAIVTPVVALPVILVFIINYRKAKKLGVAPEKVVHRTLWESIKYYVVEFDVLGLLLATAGFALVLLPFSLAASSADKWRSGSMIAMLVVGVVALAAFVLWERNYAPVQFLPFRYLKDRTILGGCIAYFSLFISVYCWDIYFSSYLQVVNQVSIRDANYILNSYSLTSSIFAPIVGFAIRYFGKFKWVGMTSIPFITLGTALLIYFRQPGSSWGYLVMCQIFNGIAGAVVASCAQMAVMAPVGHNEVAVTIALQGLFGSIGSAVGLSVSGALWTNLLPGALARYLPEDQKANEAIIYGDITAQLAFPWGSPTRDAIVKAYAEVQRKMCIAGASFIPLLFVAILMWRNIDVREKKQTKGNVL